MSQVAMEMSNPPDGALDAVGLAALRMVIREYGSAITAFSAGIDSTLVAVVAQQELGKWALAATAVSPSLAPTEREHAGLLAAQLHLNHRFVATREMEDERYASNPVDRCYFCKTHLYAELEDLATETGARYILNGLNVDDLGDWRPGARAAAERPNRVRSPLQEAGLGKGSIRRIAQTLEIPNWDKPALACLSSRLPYGERVTVEKLARIAAAEGAVRQMGFRQVRVRSLGTAARVEIAPAELPRVRAESLTSQLEEAVLAAGFTDVEIDPEGYRSGRLNEGIVPLPVLP